MFGMTIFYHSNPLIFFVVNKGVMQGTIRPDKHLKLRRVLTCPVLKELNGANIVTSLVRWKCLNKTSMVSRNCFVG